MPNRVEWLELLDVEFVDDHISLPRPVRGSPLQGMLDRATDCLAASVRDLVLWGGVATLHSVM